MSVRVLYRIPSKSPTQLDKRDVIYHKKLSLVKNTDFLSSNPSSAIHHLCDLRQVAKLSNPQFSGP